MLVVDTHAHLFSPDEAAYPPKTNPSRPPHGKGTIEHLRREMATANVTAVCAVQVSGFYGFDNRYICDASKAHPDWIAGVVTLDPDDPSSPARLAGFVNTYGVRALRSVPARGGKLDTAGVRDLWRFALEHSVTVNLQVGHELADEADRLLVEFPDLPVVLDHALRLEPGGPVEETLAAVRKLAKRPNCYAKLSSIANGAEGCPEGYPCATFHGPILAVIDALGAERCAWGAHFPLEKYSPKLTYAEHLRIYVETLPLTEAARRAILGETELCVRSARRRRNALDLNKIPSHLKYTRSNASPQGIAAASSAVLSNSTPAQSNQRSENNANPLTPLLIWDSFERSFRRS